MKTKYLAIIMAAVLSFGLLGCSRRNETGGSSSDPQSTPSTSVPGNIGQENDSFEGGGAGGTNDGSYSDVTPKPSHSMNVGNDNGENGGMMDDIGDAADDLIDGAGDAIQDAGDAIGNAADNIRGTRQR